MTTRPRKLIETVIPLPEINDASAYDKMPGIGPHPKGIHHWWARLPLPCARAILFASVVDDPADVEDFEHLPETEQARLLAEREKLFDLIKRLLQKRPHENADAFREAREVIEKACGGKMPEVLDPFTGGGSIPLEAQRLGFQAHGRDLNPVPALITKATIDYPARFFGQPAINPEARQRQDWHGAQGLAEDVRYYGQWMLQEAKKQIGHLYPDAEVTAEMAADRPDLKPYVGKKLPVIAWIWARTVESPDPVFAGKHVPLISTYWLSSKAGKEAWLEPVIHADGTWEFAVQTGKPSNKEQVNAGTKSSRGANFVCLLSGAAISDAYVKEQGCRKLLGMSPIAVVCDGGRKRVYLSGLAAGCVDGSKLRSVDEFEANPEMPDNARWFSPPLFGFTGYLHLFSPRQLTGLTTFSDLVGKAHAQLLEDGAEPLYAGAVATYLAMAVDRLADFNCSLSRWKASGEQQMQLFGRHAIPMVWDFCEANVMGDQAICWQNCVKYAYESVSSISILPSTPGTVAQQDAAKTKWNTHSLIISTDPPYYDNIGYADLSDFFYVWLRRSLKQIEPDLTRTMLTPKKEELIATPYRHEGDSQKAKEHFEKGFKSAFSGMKDALDPRFPLTVYYAMKQSEDTSGTGDSATGWETLLNSLINPGEDGFQITATWPVRAAQNWRMISMGTNALASYIVLACRPRPATAPTAMRRDFLGELRSELPEALKVLQHGNIAPVDLAQAAIGPGMALYSRHREVLEPDGRRLTVRTALQLINQVVGEILDEQEGEFDPHTRWAVTWFKEHGFEAGPYGKAEELAVAKAVAIPALVEGGILHARAGEARLLRREELPENWDPRTDKRVSIWEATEHLIRALQTGGETAAASLLAKLAATPFIPDAARDLAYLLFTVCERKGWNKEALGYNTLVVSWPNLTEAARSQRVEEPNQRELL
jgi:putative DNA methylase